MWINSPDFYEFINRNGSNIKAISNKYLFWYGFFEIIFLVPLAQGVTLSKQQLYGCSMLFDKLNYLISDVELPCDLHTCCMQVAFTEHSKCFWMYIEKAYGYKSNCFEQVFVYSSKEINGHFKRVHQYYNSYVLLVEKRC